MSLGKFSVVSGFSNMLYAKKRKLGNAGSQQKCRISTESLPNKKYPLVTVTISRKLLESNQFAIQVPFWL